jgi:hypothetical protein
MKCLMLVYWDAEKMDPQTEPGLAERARSTLAELAAVR